MGFYTIGLILILIALILIVASFISNTINYARNLWWGVTSTTSTGKDKSTIVQTNELPSNLPASISATSTGGAGFILGLVGLILLWLNKSHSSNKSHYEKNNYNFY